MTNQSFTQQIDEIIKLHDGWKSDILSSLRQIILETDKTITEEVKWKTASRPEGLPVWSHQGIICYAEIWKDNVKLLFPKGANISDPDKLFNARLNSSKVRAIELKENDHINRQALSQLVSRALELNN